VLLNPFRRVKEDRTYRETIKNFIDTMRRVFARRHTGQETMTTSVTTAFIIDYNDLYGFGCRMP